MKIIYLHQYFNTPQMNGGTRSYELAKRFVAAGHEVHMVTSRRDVSSGGRGWTIEKIEGFTVHWLSVPYNNHMSYARRTVAFFSFALRAGFRAARQRGDVVYATSTPLTIAIPGLFVRSVSRIPMVFEVRDLWPELPIAMGALKPKPLQWAARALEKCAYRNSQAIVALSPGMAEGVAATGFDPGRIHVAPNSADLDLFAVTENSGENFREERGWRRDEHVVLYAGTLGAINGVHYLADLAAETLKRDGQIRFHVIGTGACERSMLEHAAKLGVLGKNFTWEPPIPKAEVPAALKAADLCASLFLPIREMEANSANKFFDALAAGRPVALNYGGWQRDLVKEHGIGLAMDSDPKIAALQLIDYVHSADLAVAGEASRRLARDQFSRDRISHTVLTAIEGAVNGTRALS